MTRNFDGSVAVPKRVLLHCLVWISIVFGAGMSTSSVAEAGPPVKLRGIELPTVLSFYDRARRAAVTGAGVFASDETDEPPSVGHLEALDTIVLDPGHGADNVGAVGVAHVAEKYLTLELAYAVRRRLQKKYPDLEVVLTRYWDRSVSLDDRTHMANRIDADLFMSLHYNAATHQRAVGYETYFLDTRKAIPGRHQVEGEPIASTAPEVTGIDHGANERKYGVQGENLALIRRDLQRAQSHRLSGILAETVQGSLDSHIDSIDRGVKQANFAVLRGALMPAVVVEAGFLTHPDEGRQVLGDGHRARTVEALIEAVENFDARRSK
jgi:N-acetylmuramoyl-L-alanine amidase